MVDNGSTLTMVCEMMVRGLVFGVSDHQRQTVTMLVLECWTELKVPVVGMALRVDIGKQQKGNDEETR